MTQADKFKVAQEAVKAFRTKHGNILLMPDSTQRTAKLKQQYYTLQDAASAAFWTDEMDDAIQQNWPSYNAYNDKP